MTRKVTVKIRVYVEGDETPLGIDVSCLKENVSFLWDAIVAQTEDVDQNAEDFRAFAHPTPSEP